MNCVPFGISGADLSPPPPRLNHTPKLHKTGETSCLRMLHVLILYTYSDPPLLSEILYLRMSYVLDW